ncbi:Protein of unknown function [Gryllus bimaculatus]|nr:Protein of unknown function [Gryllus bimaculatus]
MVKMETVGAICNKPLEKLKRCEELSEKNDSKVQKRLSWDGTFESKNEFPPEGVVGSDDIEFEPISNIEEVFRDPSTFDFLSQIGSSNPLRDLRKESLYVKFDPCLQSPKEENSSQIDSKLSKRSVTHRVDLVASSSDRHTSPLNRNNEFRLPDLCLVEPLKTCGLEEKADECSISNISATQSSENITLIDVETPDKSMAHQYAQQANTPNSSSNQYALQTSVSEKKLDECSFSNISEIECSGNNLLVDIEPCDTSIEKISSLKRELCDLRALLVERELAHRATKKNLQMVVQKCLQQKMIQDTSLRNGQNDLNRAIIAEYEENINSIKLEMTTALIMFQQKKKNIEGEKSRMMEHKIMTDKAHDDLSVKLCNTEKSIISLSQEIEEQAGEITRIKLLNDAVTDKMTKDGWEYAHIVESAFKDVEFQRQKYKKDLGLLDTRVKTLKVKENSLNLRFRQLTAENEYLTKMLDEATKEEK